MARIAAEVHKDHTFHPKVRASLPPDFLALQRRFERSLQAAKESNPHRKARRPTLATIRTGSAPDGSVDPWLGVGVGVGLGFGVGVGPA